MINVFAKYLNLKKDKEIIMDYKKIAFEKINNVIDLKNYLIHKGGEKSSKGMLYHYTSLSTIISIFKYKTFHLSQAFCMNDILEYTNGNPVKWEKLFFASFMLEDEENIGMWSMYGQPWKKVLK